MFFSMLSIKLSLIPIVGNRTTNQIFMQQKELNSHAEILYEKYVKNNCYLNLNINNKEHLLGYQWPFLALGKNLFPSPRMCSFLFINMKNNFFFLQEQEEQVIHFSRTRRTNYSFLQEQEEQVLLSSRTKEKILLFFKNIKKLV